MIVCIRLNKFSLLAIFIISLLLCIRIPLITSTDPVDENSLISGTGEGNQTETIDEHALPSTDNVLSDSDSESIPPEIPVVVEADTAIISAENKSEILDEVIPTTISPIVSDDQTTDEQSPTPPTTIKKNLSSINSFEEWKQQQLHADLLKKGEIAGRNNVSPETSDSNSPKVSSSSTNIHQIVSTPGSGKKGKLRKNFASASCGAKLLAHNVEAQNVASILSSSPDEYMLNPCNAKIWFVIELCESVRILNIEIANFELFSSVPKTFRVSASDRYPTKDWHRHHLGTFNASFNRTIQSFQTIESTTYLKYVKFELLDFHGHEHYCPLSVVRIHGSNVEDEIMTMEDNTNLIELKSSSDMEDENDNDDDGDNLANDHQVGGIIGSAILDLAKRVFRRQTIRGTTSTTAIPIIETNVLKTECHRSVLNGSITNNSIDAWRQSETFKRCVAQFLHGLWSKFNSCTIYLSQVCFKLNYCCQCPVILNKTKTRTIERMVTLNIYINPCGYYHILTSPFVCARKKLTSFNETISTNVNGDLKQEFVEKNLTVDKNDTVMIVDESGSSSDNQSMLNLNETLLNDAPIEITTNGSNDQPSSNNISNATTVMSESSNTTNETSSPSSSSSSSPSPISEKITTDLNPPKPTIEIRSIAELVTATTTPPHSYNQDGLPPIISSPWLKGMLVNTKSLPELFKIIEKLNFNLTLSNRYLQELSQHYVKKIDETQQTTDLLLNSSRAADAKLENLEEQFYKLQENFNDISYRLIKLEAWIPVIVCIIMCLSIWCIWSTCRLIRLRRKFKYLTTELEMIKTIKHMENNNAEDDDDDPPIIYNGTNERKLSTDSNDSNPARSQRVPDLPLTKITANVLAKTDRKLTGKPSKQTEHLLSLSAVHT